MAKETTIKVSNEFKGILQGKKQSGEDFEETLKRLINSSIPEKTSKEQYTASEYTENIVNNEEKVFTNMSDFNLEIAERESEEEINIREIEDDREIKILPMKTPLEIMKHQEGFR